MLRVVNALIEECREHITAERLILVCHDMFGTVMKPNANETADDLEKLLTPGITVGTLRTVPGFWRSADLVDLVIGSTAARMSQMVMRGEAMTFVDNEDELRMMATCLDGLQEQVLPVLMRELQERYGNTEPDEQQIEEVLDGVKTAVFEQLMQRAMDGLQGLADEEPPESSQTFDGANVVAFPAPRTLQ